MKTRYFVYLPILLAATLSYVAAATATKVNWLEPSQYTDVMVDGWSSVERAFPVLRDAMNQEFERQANRHLPPGSVLHITVLDFDMAGDFEPWWGSRYHDIRIIREIYPPRMKLAYQLLDAEGNVHLEGEDRYVELAFMWTATPRSRLEQFSYERNMVENWVRQLAGQLR